MLENLDLFLIMLMIQISRSTKKTLNSFDQTSLLISIVLSSFLNTSIAAYLNQEKVTRKVMAPNAKSKEFEFICL